ncbi:hypothetical protein QR680_016072 [Steinernema hermaphroditum]|uniref:Serpentine Receptor, class T n=1 Tax=Steinernema hermaphroditum TaxID=289476 RepID=A0AA39LLZ0_9BILA|nr:hypothetical protein QR680_016072 [Steinernema hermaphroditum]
MDVYFFKPDVYNRFYNCSMYTTREWNNFGVQRIGVGVFSIVLGVFCIAFYVPCARTMLKPKLWELPCYKLMFLNSIIDIWGIVNSCFLSGYLSITGAVFCSHPNFLYIYSALILGLWGAQCTTVIILALNRCVEFWQNHFLTRLFEGKNMIFWMALPIFWFFVMVIFPNPCPFSSISNMWVLDPYFGIPEVEIDRSWYFDSVIIDLNNTGTLILLISSYLFLIISIWVRGWSSRSATISKVQRQITIQACLLCSVISLAGGIYVFCMLFPQCAVPILLTIDFFLWQWGFCIVIVIYMVMNKALRRGVIEFYANLIGYKVYEETTSTVSPSFTKH